MRATGNTPYKAKQALRIIEAWTKRIQPQPCKHERLGKAKNVYVFAKTDKDGSRFLGTPKEKDVTILADYVLACANPCCERIFEVKFHGFATPYTQALQPRELLHDKAGPRAEGKREPGTRPPEVPTRTQPQHQRQQVPDKRPSDGATARRASPAH